jgi:hypothetical protein
MKITKFAIDAPRSTGELPTHIEFLASNPTEEDVRWTTYHCIITDKTGFMAAGNIMAEADSSIIEPGDELAISPFSINVWPEMFGNKPKDLTLTVSAIMHGRDFYKLGEVDVPSVELESVLIEKEITSAVIGGPIKVRVFYVNNDDDSVRLCCRLCIYNKSDIQLDMVRLESVLLDKDGAVIDSRSDDVEVSAQSRVGMNGGWDWLKKSQLKGSTVRLSLSVFRPIHTAECSAQGSPAES